MIVGGHRAVIHCDLKSLFLITNDVISIPVLEGYRCIFEMFLESNQIKKAPPKWKVLFFSFNNGKGYSGQYVP